MPLERGFARAGHVVEHVAALHTQRGHNRENPLHEAAAAWAIDAEAGLAPHDAMADPAFGRSVRSSKSDPTRVWLLAVVRANFCFHLSPMLRLPFLLKLKPRR